MASVNDTTFATEHQNQNKRYLPASFENLQQLIGNEATQRLTQKFGGTRIFIRRQFHALQKACDLLSIDQARVLSQNFGGRTILIASCKKQKLNQRNILIQNAYIDGWSVDRLALEYQLSSRQVYNIISNGNRKKNREQLKGLPN